MTRREIVDRLEMQARRRDAMQAELHRPMWFDDSEPVPSWQRAEETADATRQNEGQFLAWAFLLVLAVLVGSVAWWAWEREEALAQRAYCAQLQMAQATSVPDYCGEGK